MLLYFCCFCYYFEQEVLNGCFRYIQASPEFEEKIWTRSSHSSIHSQPLFGDLTYSSLGPTLGLVGDQGLMENAGFLFISILFLFNLRTSYLYLTGPQIPDYVFSKLKKAFVSFYVFPYPILAQSPITNYINASRWPASLFISALHPAPTSGQERLQTGLRSGSSGIVNIVLELCFCLKTFKARIKGKENPLYAQLGSYSDVILSCFFYLISHIVLLDLLVR